MREDILGCWYLFREDIIYLAIRVCIDPCWYSYSIIIIVCPGPAPCKQGNLGPWSATVARVHPQTVQQHRNLPDLGCYRTLVMRAKE